GPSGLTCEAAPLIFGLPSTRILRVFKHMILVRKCDASLSHIPLLLSTCIYTHCMLFGRLEL
ncbi:hypothetical protein SISSUDRAFT_1049390, partial [Sistotremastrum suecicum HHB10207 ss-3]